ncbi:DUF502 domain-containing protein [Alphaproteobacteria bacterium]|nr:DUF502 domain-containing protein [Alphaproteobacteria bacterium]
MADKGDLAPKRIGFFGWLRSRFFTGLLVTAPVLLTVWITWATVELIDSQVASLVPGFSQFQFANVPGVGLILGVLLITIIGALAAGFLGRWIIGIGESVLNRMPVVRTIYGASKQILETVISTQSDAFREVVLVEYPRRGLWVIGFVTGGTKGEVNSLIPGSKVNIFVPTTPNPTSGFLLFSKREDVIFMDMSVEDAVKLVVSGGIVAPPEPAKSKKLTAKKASGKKTSAKKASARGAAVKKSPAKKSATKKASVKKAATKKSATKKAGR